eukprot:g81418.t1
MAALKMMAKSDYPLGQAIFELKAGSSVRELKTKATSTLGLQASSYSFYSVNYLHDVIPLGDDLDEDLSVEEAGIEDRATVFLVASVEIRPARAKPLTEEELKENRYAGLTPGNVLTYIRKHKGKRRAVALEFADIHMSKILKSKHAFNAMEEKPLINLISRNTLNVNETKLFEAVVEWGKAELKRRKQKMQEEGGEAKSDEPAPAGSEQEQLRVVLKDALPHIRFPTMDTGDIATVVAPSGLLPEDVVLQLFTYLGLGDASAELPPLLKTYQKDKRKARKIQDWFMWDVSRKHAQLQSQAMICLLN